MAGRRRGTSFYVKRRKESRRRQKDSTLRGCFAHTYSVTSDSRPMESLLIPQLVRQLGRNRKVVISRALTPQSSSLLSPLSCSSTIRHCPISTHDSQ